MPFSPSSKPCDYAELLQPFSAVLLASSAILGIIRTSA